MLVSWNKERSVRSSKNRNTFWVILPLQSQSLYRSRPPPPLAFLPLVEEGRERGKQAEMARKRARNSQNSGGREGEGRKMRPQRRSPLSFAFALVGRSEGMSRRCRGDFPLLPSISFLLRKDC